MPVQPPLFLVLLRTPVRATDYREDPYWEVGSFGCTGCHSSNLFNPINRHIPEGAQLAFAQGGPLGSKLLLITPPVMLRRNGPYLEARWEPTRPFTYTTAPTLITEDGFSQFPTFKNYIRTSRSSNWRHKLSSKFRSRAIALPSNIAQEFRTIFSAQTGERILTYMDALPQWAPWVQWSVRNKPYTWAARIRAYVHRFQNTLASPSSPKISS